MNIQASEFGDVMERLTKAAKDGLVKPKIGTLEFQAARLLERCEKLTPSPGGLEQGAKVITKDVKKIFDVYRDLTIETLAKRNGKGRHKGWFHDTKTYSHAQVDCAAVGVSLEELAAWHKRHMKRNGRTAGLGDGMRMAVGFNMLNRYLERIAIPRVGKAKAGWLAGLVSFGGKLVDGYVRRHGTKEGMAVNGLSAPRPFVQARSFSRWATTRDEGDRILRSAIASRIRDMEKHFRLSMQKAKEKITKG